MDEVVEVELERAVALDADELVHRVQVFRRAVGRKPHDLALVAVLGEAEPLADRRVEDAERVREVDLAGDVELVALARAPHGRDEVARAIDREDRRLVVGRDEEGARHVRAVMLDVVELRLEAGSVEIEVFGELGFERADLHGVAQAVAHHVERRAGAEGEQRRLHQIGFGVAADADVIEVGGGDAAFRQARSGSPRRGSPPSI